MTLASEDGNRSLKKPYREEVLQRWRMCLSTLLLFVFLLADHLGVGSTTSLTTGAAAAMGPLLVLSAAPAPQRAPRNQWIPPSFLTNYTFNAIARASQCLSGLPAPADYYCSAEKEAADAGDPRRRNQCLHYLLGRNHSRQVCGLDAGDRRRSALATLRLGFCHRFSLRRVLGDPEFGAVVGADPAQCLRTLDEVQDLDDLAQKIYCEFDQILTRYDCLHLHHYSIKWNCTDCKAAYKAWVCAMMMPYFVEDCHVKPCRDVCHTVEQKCPYFLPDTRLQYAGEPTFLCIDHDIPETEAVSPNSSYGEPPNCYLPCHLDADSHEHSMDPVHKKATRHCHTLTRDNFSNVSTGTNCSVPSGSSSSSLSSSSSFSWQQRGPHLLLASVSLYVTLIGFCARTFSSLPFCLGLT